MKWKFSRISAVKSVSYLVPVLAPMAREYTHAQIAVGTREDARASTLGSDSKKPPRPRHRFSFSGQSKRPERSSMPRSTNVTRDDILNSLTKHAHPQQGPVEEVSEMEESAQVQD